MKKRWLLSAMLSLTVLTVACERLSLPEQSQRKEAEMGVSNNVVTIPINPKEVYQLMGLPKYNGWWDVGYLCSNRHGRTNMWSRYKPVHIKDAWEVNRNTLWYRGTNNDCGITPKMVVTYTLLPDTYDNGEAEWTYMPPWGDRGGIVKSPFRLLDFWKYKHDAIAPVAKFSAPVRVKVDGTFTCGVLMMKPIEDESEYYNAGSLTLNEITISGKKLSEWYMGAVVTDMSGNIKFFAAGKKLSDGTFGTDFPDFSTRSLSLGQSYYIYPCLALNPQEQNAAMVANSFLTIPNSQRGEFKVVSAEELNGLRISLTAKYMYSDTLNTVKSGIAGELTITCESGGMTFTNNYLQYRFETSKEGDAMMMGEGREKLEDFTVKGNGGTYSRFFSFTIYSAYQDKGYYVLLTLNSGQYKRKISPMMMHPGPIEM